MEGTFLEGVGALAIGLFLAWLGMSGRVRYTGRASCAVQIIILAGISIIISALFR